MQLNLHHPNDLAKVTPWQLDFRQLDAGRLSTKVTARASDTMIILNIAMTGNVHQQGASPEGWTTLGIPKRGTIKTWQGQDVGKSAFLSFGNNDGFDGVSTSEFEGNVLSFDSQRFLSLAQACGFDLLDDRASAREALSKQVLAKMNRLERRISDLIKDFGAPWSAATEEALMLESLTILTDSEAFRDKSRAKIRSKALNLAIEMMKEHLEDPIPIRDICLQCGASWRTLDRAFNERFGCGPKTYYIRLRLNRVRESLCKDASVYRIVDVANRNGFWHMGQFARDYRRFFGELPSQTQLGLKGRQVTMGS